MFTKLIKKMKNMTGKDWAVVSLWLLTLVLLFVFVGVAAGMKEYAKNTYANAVAAVALVFTVSLFSALFVTVWVKYIEKRRGVNHG